VALRNTFAGGVSAPALAIAIALAPITAYAQTAVPAGDAGAIDGDAIVVQGYRKSIENAISLKRESPVIAEAFSSEDIGKLPDVSIAETLGRLPGLAMQRIDGRSQSLTIRGLGPDFSTTMLNGREQVSSGDNRGVEYDQYPSELIDSGVVYKTPFAGLVGQGLAGTVDLHTIRPLSKRDRILAVSGRFEFNDQGSLNPDSPNKGYRATAVYVDQFADDTLGIALGAAYQSSPSQVERFRAWGYPTEAGHTIIGGMKPFAKSVNLKRLGLFGTLEWKASENITTTLDVFYADYKERQPQRGIEFPLNPGWGAGTALTAANPATGFAESATFTGVQPVIRNDYDSKNTRTFAAGWNTKFENDHVILSLDASYSRSKRDLSQIESYSGLTYAANAAGPSDTVSYTHNANGIPFTFTNKIDYSNTSLIQLTDPRGWGAGGIVQAGFLNDTKTLDELWSVRGEVVGKVESGFIKNLVAGINYADRSKTRNIDQFFLSLAGGASVFNGSGAILRKAIPASALLSPTASLGFLGFGKQVTYDPRVLIANGTYVLTQVENSSLPYPGDWTVNEKVTTGYLRADIDTDLGGLKMTGNIGVQLVFTDQSSDGFVVRGGNNGIGTSRLAVSFGDKYAHVLPSASFNFALADTVKLRLGAARTLARPRMDQLNASQSPGVDPNRLTISDPQFSAFSASGGNPNLRPYVADGVDVSLEKYFGRGGYISVAGYYKWLKDYVNPNNFYISDFSYLLPTLSAANRAIVATTLGRVTAPKNTSSGFMRGFEISGTLPFGEFSQSLDGFGIQASGSYTDSELTDPGVKGSITVPGLSKWVLNGTVYFEKAGFEARASYRHRSTYLAEFIGISAGRDFRQTYPESIIDAQLGYRFQSGSLEGLSITVQGLNLTNEPFINFPESEPSTHVIDYERYGRTFLVGASYKF
jgi:iron complex outermembrane recepter protein